MASIAGFMTCLLTGVFVGGMGVWQIRTGNASLLHGYHRVNVTPQDMPLLARETGYGLVLCGASCMILSFSLVWEEGSIQSWISVALGSAVMVAALVKMLRSIIRYNGSLFG